MFYVTHKPAHVTFYVTVVEAEDVDGAREASGETEGIGYFDGDWDDGPEEQVFGPFETEEEAMASDHAWTEGSF